MSNMHIFWLKEKGKLGWCTRSESELPPSQAPAKYRVLSDSEFRTLLNAHGISVQSYRAKNLNVWFDQPNYLRIIYGGHTVEQIVGHINDKASKLSVPMPKYWIRSEEEIIEALQLGEAI